jgi:hypothetical protein
VYVLLGTLTLVIGVEVYLAQKRNNPDNCHRTGKVVVTGQCDSNGLCGVLFKDIKENSGHLYLEQGLVKYPVVGGMYCIPKDITKQN